MQIRYGINKWTTVAVVVGLLAGCTGQRKATTASVAAVRFAGEYLLPDGTRFNGTLVGGLSSIDYDPKQDLYYFISDDRSEHNLARFYTAKIFLSANGIDSLRWVSTAPLRQKNGNVYPSKSQDSLRVPDPEAMRLNASTGDLVWSSEGERIVRRTSRVLQNPSVNIMGRDGLLRDTFPLPPALYMSAAETGPRRNGVFEGLAFADDYKTLYVSVEEPLYQDGPRASLQTGGWIRIIKYDVPTKVPAAQYAYQIDAIAKPPVPKDSFSVNGVPDILAVNNHQLLVTERSWSYGYIGCTVRVYLVDVADAEDVSNVASLSATPPSRFLRKKLLLDMTTIGREVYNIEGATFGPQLPNGKRSLLFIADDNFSGEEKTQLLLFEVE